jgi:hypothetical protein
MPKSGRFRAAKNDGWKEESKTTHASSRHNAEVWLQSTGQIRLDLPAASVVSCQCMKKHYPLTIVLICSVCFLGLAVKLEAADKSDEKATAGTDLRPLVASKKLAEGKNLIHTEKDGLKLFLTVKGTSKTWSAEKKDGAPVPLFLHKNKKQPPVCTVCHKDVNGPLVCQTVPCDTLTPLNPD